VYNGYFLDNYGYPRVKTYSVPTPILIDMHHHVAGIPGKGQTPVSFSHTFDVAKFAVALLDTQGWERISWVVCDSITPVEFLKLAEEISGMFFFQKYSSCGMGMIRLMP
jgi:hypothetical protein